MIVPYAPPLRDFSELGIAVGLVEKLLDFDLALVRTFVTLSPGLILIQGLFRARNCSGTCRETAGL